MKSSLSSIIALVAASLVVTGCAGSVTMEPASIPRPLVEKIPVSVGLKIPPEFRQFVHEESNIGSEDWSIDLGSSNAALFTQLFGYMFDEVRIVAADEDPGTLGIDALIEPSIDDFEFSTPGQSRTGSFAVWIRYRLKVYDSEGNLVSNWPVSAYGKSLATSMGKSEALQRAATLAMRDAAALMIMKFDQVTRISQLADSSAPKAPTPGIEAPPVIPASTEPSAVSPAPGSQELVSYETG